MGKLARQRIEITERNNSILEVGCKTVEVKSNFIVRIWNRFKDKIILFVIAYAILVLIAMYTNASMVGFDKETRDRNLIVESLESMPITSQILDLKKKYYIARYINLKSAMVKDEITKDIYYVDARCRYAIKLKENGSKNATKENEIFKKIYNYYNKKLELGGDL